MQHTRFSRVLSGILCIVLLAAMALCEAACSDNQPEMPAASQTASDVNVLGEGATVFDLKVTDADGSSTAYEIRTDKDTVGAALLELGLIEGEESQYGLFIKAVNGITADFDADGTYWAFYVNGEYAMSGVDTTAIEAGAAYELRRQK
ncbi:MAG: DUF4430 domain-containing protein [Clostridia bacterium]|nr:DUF4430 domain-containing protein [Clostridia bacterium]